MMRIVIGADHRGYKLKQGLLGFLKKRRYILKDFGTFSKDSCDYPQIGYEVAKIVGKGLYQRGILICKTGIGMAIVANKVRGVRAALCDRIDIARSSREHNDSNVLVLAANVISLSKAKRIVSVWLQARALGGRHKRRVKQMVKIDKRK